MAAGNCVIYKPSSLSSLIGFDLPAIFKEAGLPDGVFNYCPGRGSVMITAYNTWGHKRNPPAGTGRRGGVFWNGSPRPQPPSVNCR